MHILSSVVSIMAYKLIWLAIVSKPPFVFITCEKGIKNNDKFDTIRIA